MSVNGPNNSSGVSPSGKISPAMAAATARTASGMNAIEPHKADSVLDTISSIGQCVFAGCQFAKAFTV